MVQNRLFVLFVMLILLPGCKIDRKNAVDRDKFTFRVSDDNLLFFRNVRQIYYDFQDLPKAHWHAFRYGNRPVDESRPILIPVIVVDWMKSESYILIETNAVLSAEIRLVINERNRGGKTFAYSLEKRGRENMLEFATKIYEGIMAGHGIYIVSNGKKFPLFANDDERDTFRIVMADYYRLTRIF